MKNINFQSLDFNEIENLTHQFTLLIPTYNRTQSLKRLLNYLGNKSVPFKILILDSSRDEVKEANRSLVAESNLNIEIVLYDSKTPPFHKFSDGFSRVKTTFSALSADDDILITESIGKCIYFLNHNPDYALAHGFYFDFVETKHHWLIERIVYSNPSLTEVSPLERVCKFMPDYEATTYAIHRTASAQMAFSKAAQLGSILGQELLSSALCVINGKAARLPFIYCGRNNERTISYSSWHPIERLAQSPMALFNEYQQYRQIILDIITAQPSEMPHSKTFSSAHQTPEELLDIAHLAYLSPFLHPRLIKFMLQLRFSEPANDSKALWQYWAELNVVQENTSMLGTFKTRILQWKRKIAPNFSITQFIHQTFGRILGDKVIWKSHPQCNLTRRYCLSRTFVKQIKALGGSVRQSSTDITDELHQYF